MEKRLDYKSPELDIVIFDRCDVIATSGDTSASGWNNSSGWRENTDEGGWV